LCGQEIPLVANHRPPLHFTMHDLGADRRIKKNVRGNE